MAPRTGKRKVAIVAAAPVQDKQVADNAPTIEREEAVGQPASKRRLRARSTEEDVRKAERDNFAGYTHADLHNNIVDGMSLHTKLSKDIHARRLGGDRALVMGKAYYAECRKKWSSTVSTLAASLSVADLTLATDATLDCALEGVVSHRKNFVQLLEWFESSPAPNQRVVVCVAKAMVIYVKPNTSERVDVVLAHMRWVCKHGLQAKFQKECAATMALWVSACCRSLSAYKLNGMPTNRWWSEFRNIGSLMVHAESVDQCMQNTTGSWGAFEEPLMKVVTANDFGYALFAVQAQQVFKARLGRVAKEVVQAHLVGKAITTAAIDAAKVVFDSKLQVYGASADTTFVPRSTKVQYRGIEISFDVVSYNDEWKAHVQALARSVGSASGKLQELWGECALSPYVAPAGTSVADDVIASSKLFRESAIDLARVHLATSGDKIKAVFDKKKKWFHSLDRYCIIERSFFMSMVGESALTKVQDMILAALPSEGHLMSLPESVHKFKLIADSELLRFAGASAQAVFEEADGLLQALQSNRMPQWPTGNSDYFTTMQDRMGLFYSIGEPGSEGAVVGKAAVKRQFLKVRGLKNNSTACQYSDLTPLVVYGWLLDEAEKTEVAGWSQQILAAVGKSKAAGATAKGGSKSAAASSGGGRKRGHNRDDLRKAVSDLWTT